MEVIFVDCLDGNLDFNWQYFDARLGALVNKLKLICGMQEFKAKMADLHISDASKVGMLVFDMMEILTSMIDDLKLINKQKMADCYDFWTGKALHSCMYDDQ